MVAGETMGGVRGTNHNLGHGSVTSKTHAIAIGQYAGSYVIALLFDTYLFAVLAELGNNLLDSVGIEV